MGHEAGGFSAYFRSPVRARRRSQRPSDEKGRHLGLMQEPTQEADSRPASTTSMCLLRVPQGFSL